MAVTAATNPFTKKKRTAGINNQQEQPKNEGPWTDTEKSQFESAISLLGWGNWLAFADVVSTRDNKQIKSHAQKWEKYHSKEKAQLIQEYEARKIVEAAISAGMNMAAESGDVASGGSSISGGGGGTKKKRVARRRGSLTKAKTPTPTTTRARRRSSAPGNIIVHQEQKILTSGGGVVSKRRGSLRSSIRNSIKKNTSSTSAAAKKSTTPTRKKSAKKMSPEKTNEKTSSLSTSSHDIISSVTSRVSRVTLGEEPTTPDKSFKLMTPNAPTKQMVRNGYLPHEDEKVETYDELAVLASSIIAPNSPDESTALASMVGNDVPYSPIDSSHDASSFNTTLAGQYDIDSTINMEDLVNDLDLDLDLKYPPETPPSEKKEEGVPTKTEEGEEIIEPLPVDGRNLASMVTIPDFIVNPKWNMVDSDDEEPASNNVAVAASGSTNTQVPPPPPPPCLLPDQQLYRSIQMHLMSPPDFNNQNEYIQTENGLSRMAMDKGRLCRVRIMALLTNHLEMGWWRENVSASGKGIETSVAHHQDELASFKKFGLERLIALTAIMLDVNEWHTSNETVAAAAASFASYHVGQHFNDEDDIRHIGQLISGLWERVTLSIHRGGLAFLCNDPSTSTERMSAIDTAVAMLDWNSRRSFDHPAQEPTNGMYGCGQKYR